MLTEPCVPRPAVKQAGNWQQALQASSNAACRQDIGLALHVSSNAACKQAQSIHAC